MANAARAGIRQDDRFEIRRHEEYRRAPRRRHYGGAAVAALRRQDAMGAPRHRRHRHGLTPERDQPQLGLRLRRAAVGPAGGRILREVTPTSQGRQAARYDGTITMTEIVFYQLQRQPLERVLPTLIEKSLERGWRVVVQAASEERVEALDAHLWTFRDDSFLPHGTWREAEAREQPILLTLDGDNPNGAAVRFLIDGAPMPADADAYQRIVLIVDGEDPDAVAAARA